MRRKDFTDEDGIRASELEGEFADMNDGKQNLMLLPY